MKRYQHKNSWRALINIQRHLLGGICIACLFVGFLSGSCVNVAHADIHTATEVSRSENNLINALLSFSKKNYAKAKQHFESVLSLLESGLWTNYERRKITEAEHDDIRKKQLQGNSNSLISRLSSKDKDAGKSPRNLAIDHRDMGKIIRHAGEEIRRFLSFIVNPSSDRDYLSGLNPEDVPALVGEELILAAQDYDHSPDQFSNENLVSKGKELMPTHSVRIEIDEVEDSSIRQILLRGIPMQFAHIAVEHLTKALSGNKVIVTHNGGMSMEFRSQKIKKDVAIDYLVNNFDSILDQMKYTAGEFIDARKSQTIIVTDADGTIWGLPEIDHFPSLFESKAYDALVEFLRLGGIIMITTGNTYERTIKRLEEYGGIPSDLRNRIIVSTSGSATFYVYGQDGRLKEVEGYQSNFNEKCSQMDIQRFDIIYVGDSERRSANDYPSFKKVGFNRSLLVSPRPIEMVPDELRGAYIGGNLIGTRKILKAAVSMTCKEGRDRSEPVFAINAVDAIKKEIIRNSFGKIEDDLNRISVDFQRFVTRTLEILSVVNNVVLIQGEKKEGEKNAEEIAQKLIINGLMVDGYRVDLNRINFTDPATAGLFNQTIEELIPSQGKIVLVLAGLENLSDQGELLKKIINHPQIVLVGITKFEGYRELEKDRFLAKGLHFLVAESDADNIKEEKRVLIIGASGFLGEKMLQKYKEKAKDESNILGTVFSKKDKYDQLDVTDEIKIEEYLKKHKVDVVIYAAGEADADKTKKDLPRARALNASVVSLIRKNFNGKFVYFSTEYIFDGKHETAPYISTSQRGPVNEYGITKLEGEDLTLQEFENPIILRLGVLYGYNHPNDKKHYAKIVLDKLRHGQDFEADNKQLKRPVLIDDVAFTTMKLINHDASGIFHINGYEPMTKYQEAQAIAQAYYEVYPEAKRVIITPTYTEYSAPRPLNTFMVNTDTTRPFSVGIKEMIYQAALYEDMRPTVREMNGKAKKNVVLDPGEQVIFNQVQKDVREGRLTPDNVSKYNRVKGDIQSYDNVEILPDVNSKEYRELVEKGGQQRDAIGFPMGGLSTRSGGLMRLGYRFLLGKIDSNPHSIIEWRLGNIRHYNATHEKRKPVIVMTSYATEDIYHRINHIMNGFGLQESGLYNYDGGLQQRLIWDPNNPRFGELAKQDDGAVILNPPGHYGFIRQAVVNGTVANLKRKGMDFIFQSNMTNFGALVDEKYDAIRGLFYKKIKEASRQGKESPMTLVEVIENTGNRMGTYPVYLNGLFALVRGKNFPDTIRPENIKYYNSGNYHFYLNAILERLGFDENYDRKYTKKEIALKFDEAFKVKPLVLAKDYVDKSSSAQETIIKTLQIERNLDDFIGTAPAIAVKISKNRFISIKTEDSLRKDKANLASILEGKVDVHYSPYQLDQISEDDKERATTSFVSFRDYIRNQIWGGHWIQQLKNLQWDDESVASESIEVSSHPGFPSIMILHSGKRMDITNVDRFGFANEFFGKQVVEEYGARIPFMLKFLDAQRALSIQVHPSKEEVFFILNAEENNETILGLREGVTEEEFRLAVKEQDEKVQDMVYRVSVKPGEVYRIPYGAVHGFQRGIQAIELSHASDLTYRIYDYKRKENLPALYEERNVHVRESLESINFDIPRQDDFIKNFRMGWKTIENLPNDTGKIQMVSVTPEFHVDRFIFSGIGEHKGKIIKSTAVKNKTNDRFHVLMAIKGSVLLKRVFDGKTIVLKAGKTIFIPANLGKYEIITNNDLQSIVYRFYPKFPNEFPKKNIGISLGGSKFAIGLVDNKGRVLSNSAFNWRERLKGEEITPDGIEEVIMEEIDRLLKRFAVWPKQIEAIGVAWPGPVDYKTGRVTATYLPFKDYSLTKSIKKRFKNKYDHEINVKAVLDVLADVLGELKHEKGGLQGQHNGIVLNIATGIAVGVLKNNDLLDGAKYLSKEGTEVNVETGLPQIGRHLIRPKDKLTAWEYRPTPDGATTEYSDNYERLSRTLGGPFIAKRFITLLINELGKDNTKYFSSITPLSLDEINKQLTHREDDAAAVELERKIMTSLTEKAYQGDQCAREFIQDVGIELGSAVGIFVKAYPEIMDIANGEWNLILVGSVGEKLGNPHYAGERYRFEDDIFIAAFQQALEEKGVSELRLKRSVVEKDGERIREIIAFKDGLDREIQQNMKLQM